MTVESSMFEAGGPGLEAGGSGLEAGSSGSGAGCLEFPGHPKEEPVKSNTRKKDYVEIKVNR